MCTLHFDTTTEKGNVMIKWTLFLSFKQKIYTYISDNAMWKMKITMLTWYHSTRWHQEFHDNLKKSCKLPSNSNQKLNSKLFPHLALWKKKLQSKQRVFRIAQGQKYHKYVFWILLKILELPKLRESSPCTSLFYFKT